MRRFLPKTIAAADTGTLLLLAFLASAAAYRIFLAVNLPIWLRHTLIQEDALYLRLAASLASGHWLGPYDQLTLMKGPGYPLFLALNSFTGVPISAAHAVLQVAAVAVAAWAVYRLSASKALAAGAFLVLAFLPAGFMPAAQRIIAEQIYWPQVLLVFSLSAVLLYAPPQQTRHALALGLLLGAMLGSTWLTRADSAGLMLGLLLLAAGAFWFHREPRAALYALAGNVAAAAASFIIVLALVMSANLASYGTFSVYDSKERNFTALLRALRDVEAEPEVAHVPVSAAVREKVAAISTAFRPQEHELKVGGARYKWGAGCRAYRATCGDYADEWFVWALRDAAAKTGYFENPQKAAEKFGEIAQDIATACADGRLTCVHRQAGSFVAAMQTYAGSIAFLDPGVATVVATTSKHIEPQRFDAYWALLNDPFVSQAGSKGLQSTVDGWFRDSASMRWPSFAVYDRSGRQVPSTLKRKKSPDLQTAFKEDRLGWNRFELSYLCPDLCTVVARAFDRPELRIEIDKEHGLSTTAGTATLFVDAVRSDWTATADLGAARTLALSTRLVLVAVFGLALPLLIFAGFVALIAAIDGAWTTRSLTHPALLVAVAAWLLVAVRIVELALAEIGPLADTTSQFGSVLVYLALLATFLSFGAVIVEARLLRSIAGEPGRPQRRTPGAPSHEAHLSMLG
jgi:hypothetical protein